MPQAGDDAPITFTRAAGKRIADAVRKVEIGDRGGGALTFRKPDPEQASAKTVFRIAVFDGSWAKSSTTPKVVTYKYVTNTPNTVNVINLFANIGTSVVERNCAIAREGTAWYLIAAECT